MAASTRGTTSRWIGLMPSTSIASISSRIFREPRSAQMAEPPAPRDEQGGDDRRGLADDGQHARRAGEGLGPELAGQRPELEGDDRTERDRDQRRRHDRDRGDEPALLDELLGLERPSGQGPEDVEDEGEQRPALPQRPDRGVAHRATPRPACCARDPRNAGVGRTGTSRAAGRRRSRGTTPRPGGRCGARCRRSARAAARSAAAAAAPGPTRPRARRRPSPRTCRSGRPAGR